VPPLVQPMLLREEITRLFQFKLFMVLVRFLYFSVTRLFFNHFTHYLINFYYKFVYSVSHILPSCFFLFSIPVVNIFHFVHFLSFYPFVKFFTAVKYDS
jgi:hypothetical protein